MAEAFAESTAETIPTKDDLRHQVENLRSEMQALGSQLRTEMDAPGSQLRTEMHALASQLRTDMDALGSQLRTDMDALGSQLRTEMNGLGSGLRAEMGALRSEMQAFRWQVIAGVALMLLVHLGGLGHPRGSPALSFAPFGPAQTAGAAVVESQVGLAQRIAPDRAAHRDRRSEREELLGVGAGQVATERSARSPRSSSDVTLVL